jgi:hypothetical protein
LHAVRRQHCDAAASYVKHSHAAVARQLAAHAASAAVVGSTSISVPPWPV